MKFLSNSTVSVLAFMTSMSLPLQALAEGGYKLSTTGLWQSAYISEGRKNLVSGGLFSIEQTLEWSRLEGFSTGLWYAIADAEPYRELNLYVEYAVAWELVGAYVSYTRLEFYDDSGGNAYDNEFALGLSMEVLPSISAAIDYVYSTKADGSFIELSLSTEVLILQEALIIGPYMLLGIDLGYATPAYDSLNHFQVGMSIIREITETWCVSGSLNHTWCEKDVRMDEGKDEFWVTLGVNAHY